MANRRMKTNCPWKTQDKVEKAHVLEPERPGFESQVFHSLVPSSVNKLLTGLKNSILVYQKRRLIPHTLRGFMKSINFQVVQCTIHTIWRLSLDAFSPIDAIWGPALPYVIVLGNCINCWPVIEMLESWKHLSHIDETLRKYTTDPVCFFSPPRIRMSNLNIWRCFEGEKKS